ncbi:MAG: recombinase family protein, partial [Polyangiaceae bacterium]
DGDTMLGVRVLVAREEHKRIRERMVGTRKLLRDRGYYAEGLPPFGYRRALPKGHKGAEKNVLVVEPKEAELIRRVYKLCIAGHSVAKIGRALSVGRDRVFHALRNRVYLGEVQDSRGTWLRAKHEPLVDADTFSRAQAALHSRRLGGAKPRGTPSETSDWILRDVAMCLYCGARMSAAYAGPRRARRYYYRCSHSCRARGPRRNTGSFVAVRAVEAQAEPLIVARLAELREELAREPKRDPRPVAMDFSQQREKLQRRRDKYLEAFADELISRDELRVKLGKVDSQILDIDANELASRRPKPLADPSARRVVLREVAAIRTAWGRAEPSAKRAIVGQLVTSVRVATGSDLQFVWRTAEELAQHP